MVAARGGQLERESAPVLAEHLREVGAGLLVKFVHCGWLWQRDGGPYEVDYLAKRLGSAHGDAGHESCLGRRWPRVR